MLPNKLNKYLVTKQKKQKKTSPSNQNVKMIQAKTKTECNGKCLFIINIKSEDPSVEKWIAKRKSNSIVNSTSLPDTLILWHFYQNNNLN